jgi:hypothetical protein
MNTAKHILNTWLIALFWFPFISCGFSILTNYESDAFDVLPLLFVFGFLFSLPALLFCFLGMRLLYVLDTTYELRFVLWLLVILLSILASAVLICLLFFDLRFLFEIFSFVIAAAAAGATSAMMRYRQFIYFIHKKTKAYENNLV